MSASSLNVHTVADIWSTQKDADTVALRYAQRTYYYLKCILPYNISISLWPKT